MYDDGFQFSDNEEEKTPEVEQSRDYEEAEYPNIDSPRLTNDIRKDRTLKINRKIDNEPDSEDHVEHEDSPDIPNESSPVDFKRKASSNSSRGDYEVIGDNLIRETLTMKQKMSEENKENIQRSHSMKNSDPAKYAKTDKGYSELSQLKKKNLSVLVHKHAVQKDGFFSFSYPSFEVQVNPVGWKVRRKEQDFIFLREYLRKKYPQHFVSNQLCNSP